MTQIQNSKLTYWWCTAFWHHHRLVNKDQISAGARIGFIDRDISPGMGGILWSEGRSSAPKDALVQNYMIGLGGGDIRPQNLEELFEDIISRQQAGAPQVVEVGA